MIRDEWKRLIRNPLLILVLFVIILIPAIYAGLFLASMWDPYGELSSMPVAVVNLDQPVEYNGKQLNVGDDLIKNLEEDGSLDFHFVDQQIAQEGLEEGVYYCVVTIPEDFSYTASTVMEDAPSQMKLFYETNPATNYVAMKLSESALSKMETSLQEKVVKTYSESMFDSLNEIADSLQDAADGTGKIYDGEQEVLDGTTKLADGSAALKNGTGKLKEGTTTLKNGSSELKDGVDSLKDGTSNLKEGTTTLKNGINDYTKGVSSVDQGASTLSEGVDTLAGSIKEKDLSGNVSKLANGAKQLDEALKNNPVALTDTQKKDIGSAGSTAAKSYASAFSKGVCDSISKNISGSADAIASAAGSQASSNVSSDSNVNGAVSQIQSQLIQAGVGEELAAKIAGDMKDLVVRTAQTTAQNTAKSVTGQIAATVSSDSSKASVSSALSDNLGTLGAGIATQTAESVVSSVNSGLKSTLGAYTSQIADGTDELNKAVPSLVEGVSEVQKGAEKLAEGTSTLASNSSKINSGAESLDNGAETLDAGASKLKNGASALDNGVNSLKKGASSLDDGAKELNNGTHQLKDGIPELMDGTKELLDGLEDGVENINSTNTESVNADMFSNPVELKETKLTEVNDNGHAMAAYMMSVGLWVACLAFCLMYPLTKKDRLTSGLAWWASKATVLYPMALIQGVLIVAILHITLGFSPIRVGETIFYTCLTSLAFMALMYFFNVLLGKVGSFLMLVFMVFQLAGSAGTYPIEISGPLANLLHNYMPFTYTVNAFRSTIGGGSPTPESTIVLFSIFAIFTVLTIGLFSFRAKKEKQGKGNVYDWLEKVGLA